MYSRQNESFKREMTYYIDIGGNWLARGKRREESKQETDVSAEVKKSLKPIYYVLIIFFIAFIGFFIGGYYQLNENIGEVKEPIDKLISSINNLDNKIDAINKSLEFESEDHFINVQKNIASSVVAVLSSPAHNDSSPNNVIYLDHKGQAWNLGTGFSIDGNGNILTAYHVINDTNTIIIVLPDGKNIPVSKSKDIPDLDLSILYVNSSLQPLRLQKGLSYVGASVAFIGFPLSTSINGQNTPVKSTIKGSVSNLILFIYKGQPVPVYVIGATANKGNSGGPVFSLKTGEVIGIINEKIMGTEGITISTAINQELLNNLLNER